MNILITGGAGFIGRHLVRRCIAEGCSVTIFDSLTQQIHGEYASELPEGARFILADIRDRSALSSALHNQDCVVHLAAETGTGQSMYEVHRYSDVNIGGTSALFDLLVNDRNHRVKKVVTASSRAVYGEGAYRCQTHGEVYPHRRSIDDLRNSAFEPRCPVCSEFCTMLPTHERAAFSPTSLYGISKQFQEQITLLFAETIGIAGIALRFQNVYGPGQSLINPYTGILAIFANLARQNKPICVFEDGQESRDFVYIDDVVDATWKCIANPVTNVCSLNIGSGESVSVLRVAEEVVQYFGSKSTINVNGNFRIGDIRHNLADIRRAASDLGYRPVTTFSEGLHRFLLWAGEQQIPDTGAYERSLEELRSKALMG